MKKQILIIIILTFGWSLTFSQKRLSFGLNTGIGQSFNLLYDVSYSQNIKSPDFNYGLYTALQIGSKSRLRLETNINKTGIVRNWAFTNTEEDQPSESVMKAYFFNLNLRYDYRIIQYKKLEIFLSPAVKAVFSLGNYESTRYTNGANKTSHYLNNDYNRTYVAEAVSLLLKYNVTQHVGITISPEYTGYFRKFYYKCDKNLWQYSVNVGLEWKF